MNKGGTKSPKHQDDITFSSHHEEYPLLRKGSIKRVAQVLGQETGNNDLFGKAKESFQAFRVQHKSVSNNNPVLKETMEMNFTNTQLAAKLRPKKAYLNPTKVLNLTFS